MLTHFRRIIHLCWVRQGDCHTSNYPSSFSLQTCLRFFFIKAGLLSPYAAQRFHSQISQNIEVERSALKIYNIARSANWYFYNVHNMIMHFVTAMQSLQSLKQGHMAFVSDAVKIECSALACTVAKHNLTFLKIMLLTNRSWETVTCLK